MKKTIIITFLLLFAMLLFGCSTVPTDPIITERPDGTTEGITTVMPTVSDETTDSTVPVVTNPNINFRPDSPLSDEEVSITCQYLPETVENPDNLPVLKWVCLINNSAMEWSEEAVHELNQMLAEQNRPFRVQFIILASRESYRHTDWFSRAEIQELLPEADLIFGWLTAEERKEYLLPITEYVTGNAQPSLKNGVIHDLSWIGTTIDGEIYGIPTWPMQAISRGWAIDPELLANYELTAEEFKKNFWEMDELFAKIYKQNGNKPFLCVSNDGYRYINRTSIDLNTVLPSSISDVIQNYYDFIGVYFGIDYNTGTVVNALETDYVRNIWTAIMRYKDAGYVVSDTKNTQPQVYYRQTFGQSVYTYSDGFLCVPITPVTFNSGYSSHYISGVASESQNAEEAIMLLNMIAEDEAFQSQLFWGKEGRDYSFDDGDYATIYDGLIHYNMEFLSAHSYFSKIAEKENDWMLITHDGKTKLQTYLDNLDSVQFCEYPIIFDYSGFEDELDAIAEICNTYYFFYTNDTEIGNPGDPDYKPRMTEELYDQMLQELKAAGSDKIIAELQRQLDEWLAENPDWQS